MCDEHILFVLSDSIAYVDSVMPLHCNYCTEVCLQNGVNLGFVFASSLINTEIKSNIFP